MDGVNRAANRVRAVCHSKDVRTRALPLNDAARKLRLGAISASPSMTSSSLEEERDEQKDKDRQLLELMPSETTPIMMMVPSVSTVRFFEAADGSADFEKAVTDLRKRVDDLLSNNLWLAGRLVTDGDAVKVSAPLRLPKGGAKALGCFKEFIGPEFAISPGMSQKEMRERVLHQARVWIGRDCLDTDQPLAMVSVVAASRKETKFAVIFSQSHVIGDGHTYGKVVDMLKPNAFEENGDETNAASPLSFDRILEFDNEPIMQNILGFGMTQRKRFKANKFLYDTIMRPFKPPPRVRSFEISQSWIDEQKKLHVPTDDAPFISTNDIISSWFLSRMKCPVGMITCDYRNRPDVLTMKKPDASMAGNYFGVLSFKEDRYSTPGGIRSLLMKNLESDYGEDDIPLFLNFFQGPRIAIVTQWTFMPTEIVMPTYKQVLHQPVASMFVGPYDDLYAGGFWPSVPVCHIYKPTPSTLGIFVYDRGHANANGSIVDDPIIERELHPPSSH